MIIIINGPCGIGKTTVAWELIGCFDRAVMLDGDYLGAVHPFEIYDGSRVAYLYETLRHVIAFHRERGGYTNFVINYVFERPESLAHLRSLLAEFDEAIYAFRLVAAPEVIEQRIIRRGDDPAWHLNRYKELVAIQERAALRGDIGFAIDTTALTAAEAAALIWKHVQDRIVVQPYDPRWPQCYEAERARVADALGELALEIHHVGSTAVVGLAAKPIIDLMVAVRSLEEVEDVRARLEPLGHQFRDHPEAMDRRFFRKGQPRAYHLHLVEQGSETLRQHLIFRDVLRADPALCAAYAQLKTELADRYAEDRPAYTAGKESFIQEVLQRQKEEQAAG